MDAFDEKIKAAAHAEQKHAAVPEKTQKEIDLLLERLPEREPARRSSFRWQPAGLAAACVLVAAVIVLPVVRNQGSSMMAGIGSTNGTEAAADKAAAFDTSEDTEETVLTKYTEDTGIPADQAECEQVSSYGEWNSYQVQNLKQENTRYYTWNTEEDEMIDLEDLFASSDCLNEVWPEYTEENSEGWMVDADGSLVLMETDGSHPADLTKYRSLLKEEYQDSFH